MSVDFFDCPKCGRSVCECGEYSFCERCENKFCRHCATRVHRNEYNTDEEFEQGQKDACPICSLEFIPDENLLLFALYKFSVTREEIEKQYREAQNGSET
jgi:hypothetical protein